jgi:carboxyl-terminal processing protease
LSLRVRSLLALTIGTILGLSLSLGSVVFADRQTEAEQADNLLPVDQVRLLVEVLERVKADYVDDVTDEQLIEDAIRGMVSGLDKHSAFLDSDEYADIRISTTGAYSGVGLEVAVDDDTVRVVTPIDSTPAARAGIAAGDVILSVDHVPVTTDSLDSTISKLRGEPGTRVSLGIQRKADAEVVSFDLTRELIHVTSVRSRLLEPDYGYLRITHFSETTGREVRSSVNSLQGINDGPLKGLVLDLRNNPGGVLDAAVAVSDAFLDTGVIVTADGRVDEARFRMDAHQGDVLGDAALVVLVNSGSASASEIVAGALQDNARATIVGGTTYGKGSVQTVMPLSKGRAIKLTTSRYYTPSGVSIHERGIEPDISIQRELGERTVITPTRAEPEYDSDIEFALDTLKQNKRIVQSKAE